MCERREENRTAKKIPRTHESDVRRKASELDVEAIVRVFGPGVARSELAFEGDGKRRCDGGDRNEVQVECIFNKAGA